MTAISALRDGLKARLATIPGLRTHDTVPGEVNPPAAIVRRAQTRYDSTMARGSDDHAFVVLVVVSASNLRTAQNDLDAYLATSGPMSVKAAIEADPTLGGVAHFARVVSAEEDKVIDYNAVDYLAVEYIVEVTASG